MSEHTTKSVLVQDLTVRDRIVGPHDGRPATVAEISDHPEVASLLQVTLDNHHGSRYVVAMLRTTPVRQIVTADQQHPVRTYNLPTLDGLADRLGL